jgi:uncharacterized membrane protein YbhN (UPF0104 family)
VVVLGLILLLVGAALVYFVPERFVRFGGIVLFVLGLVLVIVGVLDVADVRLEDAD